MDNSNESITAKLCSYARANHCMCKQDKIFDDFLALKLMGNKEYKETEKIIENKFVSNPTEFLNKYICPIVLPRSAYSEGRLCRFLNAYKNIQYVILGAGMDTFSVRNKNKNIDIFELDHPLTQKYKLKRLQSTGFDIPDNVYFVPIDFQLENINDVLYASGFDFKKPTFFSFLGVTYYLNKSDFENTIRSIANTTSSQTEIVIDFPDKEIFGTKRAKHLADITASVGEPMQEGLELTEIKNILAKYGFSVENHMSPKDIQGEYLKNNENLKAYENVHFITALKEI